MSVYMRDNGSWRKAKGIWMRDNGTWRKAKEVYMRDNGVWRKAANHKTVTASDYCGWTQTFKYGNRNHTSGWNANGNCFWGRWNSYYDYIGWLGMRWTSISNYSSITSVNSVDFRVARGSSSSGKDTPMRLAGCNKNYNGSSATSAFSNAKSVNRYSWTNNLPAGNNTWRNVGMGNSTARAKLRDSIKAGDYVVTSVNSTNSDNYCSIIDTKTGDTRLNVNYSYTVREFALKLDFQSKFSSKRIKIELPEEQDIEFKKIDLNGDLMGYIYMTEDEIKNVYENRDSYLEDLDPTDIFAYRKQYGLPNNGQSRFVGEYEEPFIGEITMLDRIDQAKIVNITAHNINHGEHIVEFRIDGSDWKQAYRVDECNFMAEGINPSSHKSYMFSDKPKNVTIKARIANKKRLILDVHKDNDDSNAIDIMEKTMKIGGVV